MPLAPSTTLNYVPGTNLQLQIKDSFGGWPQSPVYLFFHWRNAGSGDYNIFVNDAVYIPSSSLPFTYTFTNPTGLTVGNTYDFDCQVYGSNLGFPLIGILYALNVTLTSGGGGGGPLCLVKNTPILTPVGYKPIETLSKGDLVVTDKRKVVPISAIYSMHYDVTTKETAPYTIKKNAFGHNSPPNDICVSGRHTIQIRPGVWEIPQEGAKENKLIVQDPIGKSVTYYHIALPDYEEDNLIANGQSVESLNLGDKYKESYVWNKEQNGYIRYIEVIQKSKKLTK
jgi:hypothetical protein